MPFSENTKAKQHFFLDVPITECLERVDEEKLLPGTGTKLLITLGPACHTEEMLVQMLEAGVTCARIDLTWGTPEFHRRSLQNLSAAMRRTRRLCSVWLNTSGREMIVRRKVDYDECGWPVHTVPVKAARGQTITITSNPTAEASCTVFPINYPSFSSLVEPGQQLQVGRYLSTDTEGGSLFLQVKEVSGQDVICEALTDATLDGLLTVMICHRSRDVDSVADLQLPLMTQHDVECIKLFSQEFEIDFISLSYVNSAQDVYECRALLDSIHMLQTKIVAKIERKAAIHNFVAIAEAADGVILSRGNLGLDFDPEDMAILQKRCIARCNQLGKPIILTRIVDTMVQAPRCTRAEATDVANAVLDGADGVMLGAETLRGRYPVQTVQTVMRLCAAAEQQFDYVQHHETLVAEQFDNQQMPRHRSKGSFNGYDSPDHQYGLSPTSGMTHHHYFTPTADGNGQVAGLNSSHSIYTASGNNTQQDLEGFGSLTMTQAAEVAAMGRAAVHQAEDGTTYASPYSAAIASKYQSSFGNLPGLGALAGMKRSESAEALKREQYTRTQVLRLESIASSAVRTAEKIEAGLIVVMTQSGRTASLVAKYRPPMPVLAVVVPTLRSDGLGWRLEGKYLARQCHIIRGVSPMLAAPMSEGSDDLLSEAIFLATSQNLAKPNDYVVVVCNQKGALVFKVVQVNEAGTGMKLMSGGNSLISGEDPDIISEGNPFGSFRSTSVSRRATRVHAFRGTGVVGMSSGSPMVLSKTDAEAVATEGSTHGGVLGGLGSADIDEQLDRSPSQRLRRLSSVLGRSLPGTLSP